MAAQPRIESIRTWIRRYGRHFLDDPNITSVGLGYKVRDGQTTDELCLQFTVRQKADGARLETLGTTVIPETLDVDSAPVPTDVVERSFVPTHRIIPEAERSERKTRRDPLEPGVSVSHPTVSAGTAGAIVYDLTTGGPAVLSNWHVLHGPDGQVGDPALQPGTHDDNSGDPRNQFGHLLRSHLGTAGDAALASVETRRVEPAIMGLGVVPAEIADPDLGDRVVKSGRTTGVSHGVVSRIETLVSLDYGDGVGERTIGGFEIEADPRRSNEDDPAGTGMLSDGGDSGSVWMLKSGNGRTSTVMVGLHFGGSDSYSGEERALACLASSARDVLGFTLDGTAARQSAAEAAAGAGFDEDFLAAPVPVPAIAAVGGGSGGSGSGGNGSDGGLGGGWGADDLVEVDGSTVIPYTHFSLAMSSERRFARWVAWNVDGGALLKLPRDGIRFRPDPRLPEEAQAGDELYAGNDLDRGHLARRSDLLWGPRPEAQRANEDSFFFTNISPQMNTFNQAGQSGVWGQLEDELFAQVEVQDLRISVVAGPVFKDSDREYRGFRIPREFFKVVYYAVGGSRSGGYGSGGARSGGSRAGRSTAGDPGAAGELRVAAFVLSQNLSDLEVVDLSDFATYQVTLAELRERTGLEFATAVEAMEAGLGGGTARGDESARERARAEAAGVREVETATDLVW